MFLVINSLSSTVVLVLFLLWLCGCFDEKKKPAVKIEYLIYYRWYTETRDGIGNRIVERENKISSIKDLRQIQADIKQVFPGVISVSVTDFIEV